MINLLISSIISFLLNIRLLKLKYRCTSCDLVIKNELIVSLLSQDNQDILSNINKETTKTVTDLVCPTLTNNKAPSKLCFISLQNATKCSNNFTPANVLLYGT